MIEILRPECRASPPNPYACIGERDLGSAYSYLLGIYLGDGWLTRTRRPGVWWLRIAMDARYTQIIGRCREAIEEVAVRRASQIARTGCVNIYSTWKHWICVFPQHGPGPKHARTIALEDWQWQIVGRFPADFITGLIHSDGCRATNRIKRPLKGRVGEYAYTRYFFTNHSDEIRAMFAKACGLIGVECRPNNRWNLSVAKRASVEILDSFIGPKS
jgi:hypothetical protein